MPERGIRPFSRGYHGRANIAPLDGSRPLPSWLSVTRGAGSWSRQTAPAVDGTTFIELGTAQNSGRFDYADSVGRSMLLIEPTRTNEITDSNFLDAGANEIPDGWTANPGTPGVDWSCETGGPHGGLKFQIKDTAVAHRGVRQAVTIVNGTTYAYSVLTRRTGTAGAGSIYTFDTSVGAAAQMVANALLHDWLLEYEVRATNNIGPYNSYMNVVNDPDGVWEFALAQLEAGDCPTSRIPSQGGEATRAAELCTVDPGVVGRMSGSVSFLWRPDFASTATLTVSPCMWAWAAGYEIIYDPADDKIKVVVGGVNRASSAALTFARQGTVKITVRYGTAGTQLTTHVGSGAAATVADANAWGDPGVLAPYLGSRAASVNCRPAAYGDLLLAA